jgi:hypothetical protein
MRYLSRKKEKNALAFNLIGQNLISNPYWLNTKYSNKEIYYRRAKGQGWKF